MHTHAHAWTHVCTHTHTLTPSIPCVAWPVQRHISLWWSISLLLVSFSVTQWPQTHRNSLSLSLPLSSLFPLPSAGPHLSASAQAAAVTDSLTLSLTDSPISSGLLQTYPHCVTTPIMAHIIRHTHTHTHINTHTEYLWGGHEGQSQLWSVLVSAV